MAISRDVKIRPAAPGDGADLAACWMDVSRYYAELAPEHFVVPASAGLDALYEERLARPRTDDALWLVAEVAGVVVGWVVARLEQPAAGAERQFVRSISEVRAVVDALLVTGSHQRRGVGTLLMLAVERWAAAAGAASIRLDTYAGSPSSVPFYERGMGYRRRSIVFEKRFRG